MPLYIVIDLSAGSSASSYPVTYLDAPPSGGFNVDAYKTTKLVLKRIEAGSFKMGGSTQTTLSKPIFIGLFEMTQKQWELVTGGNPSQSGYTGDKKPVDTVSYRSIRGSSNGVQWPSSSAVDSSSFLGRLRARTGLDFDLPTEAQWEYACRAGTTTAYSYGDSANGNFMWYADNSSSTHEVGTKQPNPWGLYDMHGNVQEWCLDWYASSLSGGTDPKGSSSGSGRVLRGGSWHNYANYCTSSSRNYNASLAESNVYGFRLALPIAGNEPFIMNPFPSGALTVSNYSGTYDGAAHGIGVTVASSISGATIRYATAKGGPYSTSVQTLKNVGSKTVWCEVSATGYIPQTNSATITITKKSLTIKAAAKSKTYGAADPALTYTATGLVGSDSVTGALTRDAGENVGTYAIKQGTLTAGGNYTISYTGANLTISKRALAVTAHPQYKIVGEADPPLTWSASGLIAGDTLIGALTRDAGEAVGTYAIRQGTLAASSNYTLSFTGATLEIAPAMALTSVSTRQRYPWNGLVDVDVAFEGPTDRVYRIELSATDKVGGTNLPVHTVWLDDSEAAIGNPVDVPAPGTHRLVWNAAADLPSGFVSDRVTFSAKLLNPIWSFESIPAVNPDDYWAPETVYHDVQTVASYGEIENCTPTIRCLTDEWNLEATLGANVVFSGASMGLRFPTYGNESDGVTNLIALWTKSDSLDRFHIVTLDYENGDVIHEVSTPYLETSSDARFFSCHDSDGFNEKSWLFVDVCRNGWESIMKTSGTDMYQVFARCRYGDEEHGSAVCQYMPNGIPVNDRPTNTLYPSQYDPKYHASVFFSGVVTNNARVSLDLRQILVTNCVSAQIAMSSTNSCMKNPTGRYVVPLLDADSFFTVGHGGNPLDINAPQWHRVFAGTFAANTEIEFGQTYDLSPDGNTAHLFGRDKGVAYSKGVAMPDGKRIFLGGAGRDEGGAVKMWCADTNHYHGAGIQDVPENVAPTIRTRIYDYYPAGHPFESWARRDVTCLLPNGKFCGVDEELGLVVVNPLTGEMYVASDDPVFKKGKMGCQLLPNGKVWIIPYDCEGREFEAGLAICGKLYEVDFGFTRSFSLSSLISPYLKVAEGDPEPSGIKVGLDPNGGELPGIYAQYYKGANPVYGSLPTPTRSGYTFRGWSTDGTEAGIVATTDPIPALGIRLKAVWRAE